MKDIYMHDVIAFLTYMIGGTFLMIIGFICEIAVFIGWFWLMAKLLKWFLRPDLRRRKKALKKKIIDVEYEEVPKDEHEN